MLDGERLVVSGVVKPYVAGQSVVVRFSRDGHGIATKTVAVLPVGDGTGNFRLGYASRRPGVVSVSATHAASSQMATRDPPGAVSLANPPSPKTTDGPDDWNAGPSTWARQLAKSGSLPAVPISP